MSETHKTPRDPKCHPAQRKITWAAGSATLLETLPGTGGFLLLRKDRPGWPRPIRLGPIWTPLAVLCLVLDIVYVAVGSWSFSLTGYAGGSEVFLWGLIVLVIAVALYVYRVVVEDKAPLRWKLDAPAMPAEEPTSPAAT